MVRGNILHDDSAAMDIQVLDGAGQERMITDSDLYGAETLPAGIEPTVISGGWAPERAEVSTWTGPAVAGRGLAGLGVAIALAAVVVAVLTLSGRYSWLNSRTNEVSSMHAWLVAYWAWLDRR